jgi:hypothetical protein
MDRLRACVEALRVLAKSSHADPFLVVEMRVNEFLKAEGGGRAQLEWLLQAIEVQEDAKRQSEDWSIAKEYVRSLLQRLDHDE